MPVVDAMAYVESGDLTAVRSFVRTAAVARGLASGRTELLVLAVCELATNTIQHTAGGGQVRLWGDEHEIVCEVRDRGTRRPIGGMPAADSHRGRGLAIVRHVVDGLSTYTDPSGTVVQVRMRS
jgi:anti-sigma regulatory factor (Ser/Thr protein kinase)